jgi:hypothetical protein
LRGKTPGIDKPLVMAIENLALESFTLVAWRLR